MGVVVDSSVLIAAEHRCIDLPRLFADRPDESFFISAITAAELLHGVERARPSGRKSARSRFVEAVLAEIEVVDFDLAVARTHAALWASLEKAGRMIGAYDLLIAATALHYDHSVLTLNIVEFARVSGLKLIEIDSYLN